MIQVAFDGSHSHSSASERIDRPVPGSRLNSARESFGVKPRRARLLVLTGAVRINTSNIACHTDARARASSRSTWPFLKDKLRRAETEFSTMSTLVFLVFLAILVP